MTDIYVDLARQAVEVYTTRKEIIEVPEGLPKIFYTSTTGVFVTIQKGKKLRGCIGTYLPTKPSLAEEIISNAISACSKDPRFTPVTQQELPLLSYEVSLLFAPEVLENIDRHNPKRHGIIVMTDDGRTGLILPDLDGVNTVHEQVSIACQKAGISFGDETYSIYHFTVEKHQ